MLLADSSVWGKRHHREVAERFVAAVTADDVATCAPIRLEVLHSARSAEDYDDLVDELNGLRQADCGKNQFTRALDVQRQLAQRGHHRGVKLPDLLVAATAEAAGLTVLHYDHDYDLIGDITGQPTEWVVPRGSVD